MKQFPLQPQQAGSGFLHLGDLLEGRFHGGALAGQVDLDLGLGAGRTDRQLAAVLQPVLQHVGLGQVDNPFLVPVSFSEFPN